MSFWELVVDGAVKWALYGFVLLLSNHFGATWGEEWRANGRKLRHSWGVLKGWLLMALVYLAMYLYPLMDADPDAAWALGAFLVISLVYFFAAGGRGPGAEYWFWQGRRWQGRGKSPP